MKKLSEIGMETYIFVDGIEGFVAIGILSPVLVVAFGDVLL